MIEVTPGQLVGVYVAGYFVGVLSAMVFEHFFGRRDAS